MSTTLSFSGKNHKWNTAEDAQPVVDAILATHDLRCLALDGNTLGVEAARVIGDALAAHPEFERAHWKDLFTGRLKSEIPDALRHLFSGLVRAGAKLKELDLSHNALGPVGVEGMVDFMSSPVCYSLEEIRLDNNGLGIKGGTMLAQSLLKLVENAKAANTPLKLKVFISGRNRLENEGAEMFAKFFKAVGTLEHVAMPQNGIFHVGIAALASALSMNPNLRIINLNDNTFTPKGAKAMAEKLLTMHNLEVIDFGDCLLKTAGAKYIANAVIDIHTKLQELRMDSNEIGVNGGLAVANAMVNKDNLKVLNLDGNQFGAEGRENIVIVLQDIGRLDCLETLENDENSASEDEDTEDEEEDSGDDEEEEDNDIQELEPSGVSPLKRADAVIQPVRGSAAEFRAQPTAARLLGLGNSGPSQLVEEARRLSEGSQEEFVFHCFGLLMRAASLATSNNKQVQEAVKTTTDQLTQAIFSENPEDLSSVATNSLLIHLGLIKCEDKKFKLEWDLRGCLLTLAAIVKHPTFPDHTKNALQLFLSRPNSKIDAYVQEKHRLMTAIFQ
ncbi:ran GTPase-activating protein 1-like isoform X2 [Portunus trituberculatus]|uniref:ran GTPase-activating protein 1-like isoform X2 n=1 Tax=Portunus trituberculatus TaxID=210409 RepID=UPI001E1CF981|nr:ran GTPase-activating protein 1-like isoform X2 [Portunus trituberculatus]